MPLTGFFSILFIRWVVKPAILFLSLFVWIWLMSSMILLFTWKSLVNLQNKHAPLALARINQEDGTGPITDLGLSLTFRSTSR